MCVKREDVPIPALSSFLLSLWMLHTMSLAFQRRRLASHRTDSRKSFITELPRAVRFAYCNALPVRQAMNPWLQITNFQNQKRTRNVVDK